MYESLSEKITRTIRELRDEIGDPIDAHMVCESLCDSEVASGDYDGCSIELELAWSQYESEANQQLNGGTK